ncbi:MAG: hypothetical protein LBG83_03055 [Oscillospiraceae bacterium]|nr:hypothetical protein [Oscillospiraceae bacterium]
MSTIIGVRFREAGRVYFFDPGKYEVKLGDRVVVETARGVECGIVAQEPTELPDEQIKHPLKEMLRLATPEDLRRVEGKAAKEAEAFRIGEEKILKHGLDMKLVNVEYNFEGTKIVFHFTADQRVDFRALVRDLAGVFRTRIELRQIGVRDEAKLLGGLGICGRPFCCSQFLGDFHPVSIKMAKEQGLSLNPTKISGTCGRLMCCLKYEEAAYEDALKTMPRPGSLIETPEGPGIVTEINAVSRNVKVRLSHNQDAPPMTFYFDPEEGARRRVAAPRAAADIGARLSGPRMDMLPETPDDAPAPHKEEPKQQQKQRRDRKKQKPKPPQSLPQQAAKQPPQQAKQPQQSKQLPQARQQPPQKQQSPVADAPQTASAAGGGKNWRERHAPQKQPQQPAYRQQRAPQHTAPPVAAVPRYSEIPAGPRRALAPKPAAEPKPQNHRRPSRPKKGGGPPQQG